MPQAKIINYPSKPDGLTKYVYNEERHGAVEPSSGTLILSKQILKRSIDGFREKKKNAMLGRTKKVV